MAQQKVIELRPDRCLLDPNFNGYKLSLNQIETFQEKLITPVDKVCPSNDQYSFLHSKLYGTHNHLEGETLNDKSSVYFVDKEWSVKKSYLDEITRTIGELVEVWKIPRKEDHLSGDYNVSFKFVSDEIAVLSDGTGLMYILNTGSRTDDTYWQCLFCDEVIHPNKPYIIQDTKLTTIDGKTILHCLLLSVEKDDDQKDRHFTCLRWITLTVMDDKIWRITATREFRCYKEIYYAYLEPNAEAFYVITSSEVECTLDSETPLVQNKNAKAPPKTYLWVQSQEDIILKFPLPNQFEKDLLVVSVQPLDMEIKYRDVNLISGKFHSRVNSDSTTWSINEKFLEITLEKTEVGLMWPEVVVGDNNGEHILDPSIADEVHQKLAHFCTDNKVTAQQCPSGTTFNSQQVEDCDFENDQVSFFERISISHEKTHKANIGTHSILLIAKIDDSLPPAFATRNDVDACLWQPLLNEELLLKHVGTLLAFGYIQASKQQRKFSVCAPDLSYSAICEYTQHVFIYRQNKMITSGTLKNRLTGSRVEKIAEQQVINIPKNEEVLGIYAENKVLFLLTENNIIAFKM